MEDSVNVLKFAECRAREIMTLMEDVTSKEPKLNLQRLPYHMRRRAASHNCKRIPRSLRLKKTEETVSKHKKGPKVHKDLLAEYNSRQNPDSLWLPTHIWFAKRFHMKKMWGYQLPFQATGKRFRSSYKATLKNALVQDLSYFCCIELKGDEERILSQLSCLTDDSSGMNFASSSIIDGTKEGNCFLYHPNSFPFNGIGPVSFLWKPSLQLLPSEHDSLSKFCRQLWIWCHPSIYAELVQVLISVFELKEKENSKTKTTSREYNFASKVNYMKTKLHFQKEPVYANEGVTMTILKDTLVRHRLNGPNALSVLTSVLNPVNSDELCVNMFRNSECSKFQNGGTVDKLDEKVAIASKEQLPSLAAMKQCIWNCLRNPETAYSIPYKTVIGLTVDDPRLYVTPVKESECEEGTIPRETLDEFFKPTTAFSSLWDEETRNEVTASQIPEHVLNKERSKYVNPKATDLKKCTTRVPVIIIHQPRASGFGSGWDIIAPQGWGMAFWIPFIYHGAQPAGFDDYCGLNLESGLPTFPCSFPDTKAGYNYEESQRENNLKKFHRYSRAKRPNFKILGVPSPFFMPWNILVREWEQEFLNKYSTNNSSVPPNANNDEKCLFTMRSVKEIANLQNIYKQLMLSYKHKEAAVNFEETFNAKIQSLLTTQKVNLKALVLVQVKFLTRGTSSNCSGIYMPDECDLEVLKESHNYSGPIESKHRLETDSMPAKKRRKILKEEAKQSRKIIDRPAVETLFSSSERKVVGYISEGGYCRLGGQGYGIGHLTLTGFFTLLELCKKFELIPIVLIREQHSFQYRPASINILNSFL